MKHYFKIGYKHRSAVRGAPWYVSDLQGTYTRFATLEGAMLFAAKNAKAIFSQPDPMHGSVIEQAAEAAERNADAAELRAARGRPPHVDSTRYHDQFVAVPPLPL